MTLDGLTGILRAPMKLIAFSSSWCPERAFELSPTSLAIKSALEDGWKNYIWNVSLLDKKIQYW